MHDVAGMGDETEPLERLPEPAPRRLDLERGERAVGIGADREERGVAEVEEPGEADNDIEAQGERGVSERIRCGVDIRVVADHDREQQAAIVTIDTPTRVRRCGAIHSTGEPRRRKANVSPIIPERGAALPVR